MTKNQEKIQEALSRIDQGLASIETDEDWLKFLRFQAQFYRYSFGNQMLIYLQNPEATFVKGFKAWHTLGRYVKRGERGIMILAPCISKIETFKEPENQAEYHDEKAEKEVRNVIKGFRAAYVYDLCQTDGDDSQLPVLITGLAGDGDTEHEIYERIKAAISKHHNVTETETGPKGVYNIETTDISVRADLSDVQKIKSLLHEYAHCIDFYLHPDKDISRNRRELIAESVAYVVSMSLGIDTSPYTTGYLKTWMTEKDELKAVADTVQKVSMKIIDELAGSDDPAFFMLKEEKEETDAD